jgi:hypothetical protein
MTFLCDAGRSLDHVGRKLVDADTIDCQIPVENLQIVNV